MYVVKNTFIEGLWLEAQSHLLTEMWMIVPPIPPSQYRHNYMSWFLHRTHLWIRNLDRLPHGFQYPIPGRASPVIVLDMLASFIDPDTHDIFERYKVMTYHGGVSSL